MEWSKKELDKLNFDKVWLQPVLVPRWVRGPKEFALIETEPGVTFNVPVAALGGSVATPSVGIKSNVIEVKSIDELELLGKEKIDGKIVFFNRPMDPKFITHLQLMELLLINVRLVHWRLQNMVLLELLLDQ